MTATGLKRVLGLPEITFIAIGATIGGGIFVFTGIVLKITGTALPIAYALAPIPVFISMLPLAMLGSAIPTVGGNYKYPSRMVSPGLAFVGIWIYALASFFGQIPLYAIGCAYYAKAIFPGIHVTTFALILVTLLLIINVLGVKLAAQIQGILVLILISALLFYAGSGFKELNLNYFSNMMGKGTANLLLGVALLTFTYFGANAIIELGGEIINPGKVIPRAFFIAFPVVAFVYILVALATTGAMPINTLETYTEPLVNVSTFIFSHNGFIFFIIGGAILALTTTLNALFLYGTKSLLMIVDDRILPESLGKINKRFGTPHILLLGVWLFSVIGIISDFSLQTLASYAALGGLIIFFPVMIAAIKFPSLYPELYQKSGFKLKGFWRWFCPGIGILMVLFFGFIIIIDLKSPTKIGWFILFALSGIVFYLLRKKYLKAKGFDLNAIRTKEAWNE